jgi:hypothetical protein
MAYAEGEHPHMSSSGKRGWQPVTKESKAQDLQSKKQMLHWGKMSARLMSCFSHGEVVWTGRYCNDYNSFVMQHLWVAKHACCRNARKELLKKKTAEIRGGAEPTF